MAIGVCNCDSANPYMGPWHAIGCCALHVPRVAEKPKFEEPKLAGLTGAQWSQLRLWEDENRCDFEDDLNDRCPDDVARGSRFCDFHAHDYDEYDSWRDRAYEE